VTKTRTPLGAVALLIAVLLFGVGALTNTVIMLLKGYRYNQGWGRWEKK